MGLGWRFCVGEKRVESVSSYSSGLKLGQAVVTLMGKEKVPSTFAP